MKKQFFILLLALCLPVSSFAGWKFRVGKTKAKTPITGTALARQVRGITERGPLTGAQVQGPITRAMQQGVLRHLEVPTSNARIPATRSNPRFEWGRKLREQRETFKLFIYSMKGYKEYKERTSFSKWVQVSRLEAAAFRESAEGFFSLKKEKPEHEFYFYDIAHSFYFHPHFSAAQLRDIRAFYEKVISKPDVFTSDMAFADALSAFIGISFIGDAYLAEKMFSLAKQAPEGRRFLTDFTVVRSLLNLERYDLVQELMDFRQAQEGWFRDGQLITEGETARVYQEIKLYKQTVKNIPVTFSEELPARKKISFSEVDNKVIRLMEAESLGHFPEMYESDYKSEEYSTEGLQWFLDQKHKDLTHRE